MFWLERDPLHPLFVLRNLYFNVDRQILQMLRLLQLMQRLDLGILWSEGICPQQELQDKFPIMLRHWRWRMMTERLLGLMDEESLGIDGKAEREPSGSQVQNKSRD